MERHDLNEGGAELPVFIWDLTDVAPPLKQGFHFSFEEPGIDVEVDLIGPYPTREAALTAADTVAHEAIRLEATEALLSTTRN